MPLTGTFECDNPILNQLVKNAFWGIRGNYKGIPLDCPQRDERQPWLGDHTNGALGESFLMENGPLYAKWMDDIRDAQREDGCIPDVVPAYYYYYTDNVTFAFNRYSAKVMKQSGGQMLKMMLAMPKINRDLQRLRDRGYPIKNILDIIQNDDRTDTIVYTSPEFQPCADTFSDKYAFVGPSIRPATETVEKAHDVLIYISMGTVNNDLLPFYRACIAAFADSPYQVILSTGEQIDRSALGTLPDNITALPHVDQIAVLQKADVFLSHCGMNSASESLYFGVPLVLFPQTNEQGGVAARVAELGAGLKLEKADAASIRTAVDAVLQTPSYRANAQNIRESFLRCGGAKAAVDRILSVADRK